jgi:processive 1,2-diacylglycerol beta-glucosyltransferase
VTLVLETGKRVLIVSASIGAGHNQAAAAIEAAWKNKFPQDKVHIVDFMSEGNSRFNYLIKEIYLKTITISPDIYELLYRWTQSARSNATVKVQDILFWSMQTSMARLLRKYRPTLVICTHPFPCGAIACLKRRKNLAIPVVGVVTDFVVHPFWLNGKVDQYIVAAPELKASLVRQGISPVSVCATGIPIHPRFALPAGGAVPLNLDRQRPVLLIMGGGLGLGPLQELLVLLNRVPLPLQLIVVAGNNTALYEKLQELAPQSPHQVHILAYTQYVMELMRASDLLITKPGALTISEALAVGLPSLFYETIPGQEMDNACFIIKQGGARWLSGYSEMKGLDQDKTIRQLNELLSIPGELAKMRTAAKAIGHSRAALAAVDAIHDRSIRWLTRSTTSPASVGGE